MIYEQMTQNLDKLVTCAVLFLFCLSFGSQLYWALKWYHADIQYHISVVIRTNFSKPYSVINQFNVESPYGGHDTECLTILMYVLYFHDSLLSYHMSN